jgi:Na+-driven multidrug efflux pump
MHIVGIGYLLYMITSCIQGYFTGMGRPGLAMLLLIFYYLITRISAAILLEMHFGLDGIWLGLLTSHILAYAAAVIGYRISVRCKKVMIAPD